MLIEPCPFCDRQACVELCTIEDGNTKNLRETHYVKCDGCQAQGPEVSVASTAIDMWNRVSNAVTDLQDVS